MFKKLKPNPYFTPYTELNSKWNQDFEIRSTSINILRKTPQALVFKDFFKDMMPTAKAIESNQSKWNYIKLNSFCLKEIQPKENIPA